MDVLVYVETNFLMSVALGREARGNDLLAAVSGAVRVALPSGCYMEAFSAFEDERKRRNWFKAELDKQIAQLQRDTTSAHASALLTRLEEGRVDNLNLFNDVKNRLFQLVDRAASILERISETPAILHTAVSDMLITDPTDNLILHSILDHASRQPAATKALLTDNTKDFNTPVVQAALNAVGIGKPFRNVTDVLGWLHSLTP